MKLNSLLLGSAALVSVSVMGSAASAAPLLFSYTPTTDTHQAFTFNVDSNPTPTYSTSGEGFDTAITNATGQYAGFDNLTFYSGLVGGGFEAYFGPQLYTGTEAAPQILSAGTFPIVYGFEGGEGILTISAAAGAVPEPASWAMMILGMGAVGYAMRRKVRQSDAKFDARIKAITYGTVA